MSEENVEIVRRVYEAFNHRDTSDLADHFDERFVWYPNPDDPEQDVRRTWAEVVAAMTDLWEGLPGLHTEPEELIDRGDTVIAVVRHSARVAGSDDSVERREAHVLTFRQGKLIRLAEFPSRERALEAAGLSE